MPEWKREILKRLAQLKLAPAREAEIAEELAQHLEERYQELLSGGSSEDEARLAALAELSDSSPEELARGLRRVEREAPQEPTVTGHGGRDRNFFAGLWQDVRYGARMLRKNPGFTVVAVMTLALGIGANTAIFSVVNGVLLQPLPYRDPGKLVMLYERTQEFTHSSLSYPNFLDYVRENRSFSGLAAYRSDDFNFTGRGGPEHLSGEFVSAGFWKVLGVHPLFGRGFLPQEDRQGAEGVVILSHGLWLRRFGGDSHVVGKTMTLNARDYSVVGVLPADFRFRSLADVYVPLGQGDPVLLNERGNHPGLRAVARLKPGVTLAAAQAEMTSIARQLAREYPKTNGGRGIAVVRMKDDVVHYIRPTLLLLLGAVGFVLIIACANVANLLLARSTARSREFAIRTALGANRRSLIRQLLTESVLLALIAGAGGLLLAYGGTRLVVAAIPGSLPHTQSVGMDPSVLLFTLAISILTGVLFGLAPAFKSSAGNPLESLKEGARGSGGGRHRTEQVLVALEVGLAVVLLAGAGLMIKSIWQLWRVDPGFDTHHVLTAQVALSPTVVGDASSIRTAFREMLARVDGIPGVEGSAITNLIPLGENDNETGVWEGGGPQPPDNQMWSTLFYVTTPDYLRVMRIPLLKGRYFTDQDTTHSRPVVVIDSVLAEHFFPNGDPLGKQISMIALGPVEVVGVVGHVKHWGLDSDDTAKVRSEMYFPFAQIPDKYMPQTVTGANLLVRTTQDPRSEVSTVRGQVAGPNADQPMYGVQSMEQIISLSLAERRFTMLLLILFASTALALASIGIYGVMSYSVSSRTHELGVRMAIGAGKGDVLRLVIGQGMVLTFLGLAAGIIGALGLTRFLASMLYGVKPTDPLTLAVVSALLTLVATLACYIPARRASNVDPMVALRYE